MRIRARVAETPIYQSHTVPCHVPSVVPGLPPVDLISKLMINVVSTGEDVDIIITPIDVTGRPFTAAELSGS